MIGRVALLAAASTVLLGGCQLVATVTRDPIACLTMQVGPVDGVPVSEDTLFATADMIDGRLQALDTRASMFRTDVLNQQVTVGLPARDIERWQRMLPRPGELTFVPVPPEQSQNVIDGQPLPAGLEATPMFDGTGITRLEASSDELGRPSIALSLDAATADLFDAYAAAHFGERFAIVLDGIVLTAPVINATEFGGQAQISGDFSAEDVEDLMAIVGSGPLPAPVEVLSVTRPFAGAC